MGRFATTVALYEELRPPYPPSFFRKVAQRLALDKQHALIDLGTGPGRLVAPEGVILICASFSATDGRNPWLDDYNAARRVWSKETLWSESGSGARTHRDLAGFFRGTRFHAADVIRVETSHEVSVRDLA